MAKKLRYKIPAPLTKRNWVKKFKTEFDGDTSMLTGYMECVIRQRPVLDKIVNTAKDFDELKEQILKFVKGQTALMEDINNKWDSEDAEKYGFSAADAFAARYFNPE